MWKTVLNIIFPPHCVQCKKIGNYICDSCFSTISFTSISVCPLCKKGSLKGATHLKCKKAYSIDGLISAVTYTRVIRRLIRQYKENPYVSDLKEQIGRLMCESFEHNEIFFQLLQKDSIIIPVPLSRSTLHKRGYNHSSLLCSYVAQYFSIQMNDNLLIQTKNLNNLTKNKKDGYSSQYKDIYNIREDLRNEVKGKTILIVDDIAVTCSTLRQIAYVLKMNGAKEVWGIVFSKKN